MIARVAWCALEFVVCCAFLWLLLLAMTGGVRP